MEENGDNITCQAAPVKLGDDVFMVVTHSTNDRPPDLPQSPIVYQGFRWTIFAIESTNNPGEGDTRTGFLYTGQTMSCSITDVNSVYHFHDPNFQYGICGSCSPADSSTAIRLCTSYDHLNTGMSGHKFTHLVRDAIESHMFDLIDRLYPRVSIPAHSLPLSAFPPDYSNAQEDLYGDQPIGRSVVSQMTMWLSNITWIPSLDDNFGDSDVSLGSWNALTPPHGAIFVKNSTKPIDYFEAFKATDLDGSGFQIAAMGIGQIRPLGDHYNLATMPTVLSSMFNYSFSINGMLMQLAGDDLHGKKLGVTYLCTKTRKKWLPVMKIVSVTVGSSLGVFSTFFAVMVALARRYDNHQKKVKRSNQRNRNYGQQTLREEDSISLQKMWV